MKLFLASHANQTLDLVQPLLTAKPKDLKVAYIPTASDTYDDKLWAEVDHTKLREMWGNKITFMTDDQAAIVNSGNQKIVNNREENEPIT